MAGGPIAVGQTVTGGGSGDVEDVWTLTGSPKTTLLVILSGATTTVKAGLWKGSEPAPGSANGLMECCGGVGKATWGRHTLSAAGPLCISVQDGQAPGEAPVGPYTLTLQEWTLLDNLEVNPIWNWFPNQC